MKKYIIFALLIALSASLLIACSSTQESGSNDSEPASDSYATSAPPVDEIWADYEHTIIGLPTGEYTYVRSDIPIENDINMVSAITVANGMLYGAAEIWCTVGDGSGNQILLFSIDSETEEVFIYPRLTLLTGGHNNVGAVAANAAGDIFFVNTELVFDSEAQTSEDIITLARIDTSGNIGFSVDITEYLECPELSFIPLPSTLVLDNVGNIYVQTDKGDVLLFDFTGVYQFTVSRPGTAWRAGSPFQGADGAMLIPFWMPEKGYMIYTIDYETRSLIPYQPLPDAHIFTPGLCENELLLVSNVGVYSYCLETNEQERVLHWLDVGLSTPGELLLPVREGQFVLVDWAPEDTRPVAVTLLTRTAVQEDTRTIITLASLHPNYPLIHKFNNQSAEYRIAVLDYSGSDRYAAIARFNIDMIAGRIPDIIDLAYLDYQVFANGGFLADINTWFEQDSQISRSDFHERVFELLEADGNLYAIAPAFLVATYLAPASLVGPSPGITLERLVQLDEQHNNEASLLKGVSPQSFLEMHGLVSRSALIDFDAGTAHFETDAFLQVLEYASRLEQGVVVFERPFEEDVRRGNNHISIALIQSIAQMHYMETVAGTEITAIGFPAADRVGSLMIPTSLYGIGQGAQNPSGAWEFLRFLLVEELQREMAFEAIPVSRTVSGEVIYQLMNPAPPIDSPEVADGMFIDGVFIESAPMTHDQANRFLEMIETLGAVLSGGEEIVMNIVIEEANGFFNGSRSAQDTARVIQSRVALYVSERHW